MSKKLEPQGTSIARQKWLDDAAKDITKLIEASDRWHVPETVRISVGFPHGARGKGGAAIGQCWGPQGSADGHAELFISPALGLSGDAKHHAAQSVVAYSTLAHELVHAAVGVEAKHGKLFRELAVAIDLTGKMTATVAGEKHVAYAMRFIDKHGLFPMGRLDKMSKIGKQTTRLLKCECEDCGYTVRITKKWLEIGAPICPTDQEPMRCEALE